MATADKPIDRQAFRTQLEQLRLAHLRRIDRDALAERDDAAATEGPRDTHDAGDLSIYELADSERLADAQRASEELQAINNALARLGRGDYGRCIDCHEDIAVARLRLVPTAERCITCQQRYDERHMTGAHHPRL